MKTKDRVLEILRNNGSQYISGQEIADEIFVTRAAVWKAIKALEKDGYEIDAVTNKGYRIIEETKSLSEEEIRKHFNTSGLNEGHYGQLLYYDNVDSTNEEAKRYSGDNPGREAIFVAESQSRGRGRKGRDFFSPSGTGLYMSLLLYPDITPEKATLFTCMMAVAVCDAIKEVTDIDVEIKWVNDIYYQDKKIAGILTEGMTSMKDGKMLNMVIGIGINIYMPYEGFPENIAKTAGFLLGRVEEEDIRSILCASIIKSFRRYYDNPGDESFIRGYKEKSMLIGKYVKLLTPNHDEKKKSKGYAKVVGIDDECHLNIEYDDGSRETLSCGEVSVVKY